MEPGTSEITIRIHRGQIMKKMGAQSLADLVRNGWKAWHSEELAPNTKR